MRPDLAKNISLQSFKDFYWLKDDLQSFCREHGISASGSKLEIFERIEIFPQTGERVKPISKPTVKKKIGPQEDLSLDTVITENHRCSQNVRIFFKAVIPKFLFFTYFQNYLKNNVGKTYRDVVDAWYEEEERKKDSSYKKKIASQFEYNQFIRDFFADPNNQGKRHEDAIKAWNEIKSIPRSNRYGSNHF
ncbi:DUF6434 domain-containing protein [Bacillus testis]|uniref:DUF6434 domain-containing protein n=1 Tax=Bacillus testis TaxID=1622072 RepID=UPI00067F0990|nr:DUF6434 domain-containing protein [Bacillus testis]